MSQGPNRLVPPWSRPDFIGMSVIIMVSAILLGWKVNSVWMVPMTWSYVILVTLMTGAATIAPTNPTRARLFQNIAQVFLAIGLISLAGFIWEDPASLLRTHR